MNGRIRAAATAAGLGPALSVSRGPGGPRAIYGRGAATGALRGRTAAEAARSFLEAFAPVYGLSPSDVAEMAMEDRAGFLPGHREVVVSRNVAGRSLYGATLRLHVGPRGEFVAAVGNPHGSLKWAGGNVMKEESAARLAAAAIDRIAKPKDGEVAGEARADAKSVSDVAYPLGDVARPAVVVRGVVAANGVDRFDVVLDGITGEVLEVVTLTFYATQGQVFRNAAQQPQSPQPSATPGVVPPVPNPPAYVSRVTIPFDAWLTGTALSGNNAHVREFQAATWSDDLNETAGNPITSPTGDFSFPLTVGPGAPDVRNYPQAAGTNLFYVLNQGRDYFYSLGFDEAHGNFQVDNFGNGGQGNDPVLAFAQLQSGAPNGTYSDCCNAWMSTPGDGSSPVMGMYVWTPSGTSPNYSFATDSSLDPEVILHELTHGVTGRLVPGALPYIGQSGALNEGNSDFFPLNILTPPSAPLDGSYPVGTYSVQGFEYGIRNYPYSTNLAVNPLTYGSLGTVSSYGPEVHADGEIWTSVLWEIRAALVGAHGFAEGTKRAGQLVLDALQLLPSYPHFVDFRDALLAADGARYGGADLSLLWGAFEKRGLGALAAGGFNGYSIHVLSDTTAPSPAARLRLWESDLYAGELVRFLVDDTNATGSTATVTTTSGDSELVTLASSGPSFAGSVESSLGAPAPGDGVLQFAPGDTIAVSTTDGDTAGGTPALTAQATGHAPYGVVVLEASLFDRADAPQLGAQTDDGTYFVALPFSFPFYGKTYDHAWVSGNGRLSFGRPEPWFHVTLDQPGLGAAIEVLPADLLTTGPGDGIFWYPGPDRLTFQWVGTFYGSTNRVNAGVSIFPDGRIQIDYGDGNVDPSYCAGCTNIAVGIRRDTETFWQAVPGYDRTGAFTNRESVVLTPTPDCTLPGVTISGPSVGGCEGTGHTLDAGAGYSTYAWSRNGAPISGANARELPVTRGGTYSVVVTDAAGCVGSDSHDITYTPAPMPVITGGSLVCPGGTGAVLDAGAGYASYAWSVGGTPIPGAASRMYTATAAGSYTVLVSDGTCFGTSAPKVVGSAPLKSPTVYGSSTFCPGSPITLDTPTGYDSYLWTRDGSPVAGGVTRTLVVSQAGAYRVQVTRAGCSATSDPKVVTSACSPVPMKYWVHVDDSAAGNGNRILEAGETASLVVTLTNGGPVALTGVNATLTSSAPGVTILSASSTYPDIPAWSEAANGVPFVVTVPPTLSCAAGFGLSLDLATGQGPLAVPVDPPGVNPVPDWTPKGPVGPDNDVLLYASLYDERRDTGVAFASRERWKWNGASWTLAASTAPFSLSSNATVVYDGTRDRAVFVRPVWNGTAYVGETWEFDLAAENWTARTEVTGTPGLTNAAATWDAGRGVVVLFGGTDGNGVYSNRTWEYDGTSWNQVATLHAPPARVYHAMAFDRARGRVVVSGGRDGNYVNLADTWEYDGTDWTQGASMPTYRYYHALAYSPIAGGIVVVGGYGSNHSSVYDGSTWTSPSMPLPRTVRAASYFDSRRGRLVALSQYGNVFEAPVAGAWASRGSERPEGTSAPTVAYDPVRRETVLVPGADLSSPAGTYAWDGTSWHAISGTRPNPVAMVYAGSLSAIVAVLSNGDTWTFDGTAWSLLSSANRPLPVGASYLNQFALAYDGGRQRVVLFGGYYNDASYNQIASSETWEFDGTSWQKASPGVSPGARFAHGMAWDASRQVTVLYGGSEYYLDGGDLYSRNLRDTWEYDGSTWVQKTYAPGTDPPNANYHQMTWVGSLGGVVAYGGNGVGPYARLWNGTAWQALPYVNLPQGYWRFGFAWDSDRDVLVATNGANTFEYLRPAVPVLTAPESAVTGVGYDVTWTVGGGTPSAYEVQEATEATFSAPVTTTTSGLSATFTHATSGAEVYYYRVRSLRSCSGRVSSWSNVGSVVVSTCAAPIPGVAITGPSTACEGSQQTLDAGPGYVTYAWRRDGVPIQGGNAQTLVVTTGGTYSVLVTNASGCAGTDAHVLASIPAPIPVITGSGFVCPGGTGTVLDAGAGYVSYAWSVGGVPIAGAVGRTYTATAAGSYTVSVSDGTCSGVSAPKVVVSSALPPPVIYGPSSLCPGGSITLDTPTGYDGYVWTRDGVPVAGGTTRALVVSEAGAYRVQVTRAGCNATSDPKVVTSACSPVPMKYWVHVDDSAGGNGNRILEAGETASLVITLTNGGPVALTGVNATLTSSAPGVAIVSGSSTYPDIPAWSEGANGTPFVVAVPPTLSCATGFGLSVGLTSGQGSFVVAAEPPGLSPVPDWTTKGPVGPDQDSFLYAGTTYYDARRGRVVALAGQERWEWNGSSWTLAEGWTPFWVSGYDSLVGYDAARARAVVLLPGWNGSTYVGKTWELDSASETWAERTDVTGAPALYYAAGAWDASRRVLVVFGGYDADWNYSSGTWEYDGTAWRQVVTPHVPTPRTDHALAFDRSRGVVVMSGGWGEGVASMLSDTWEYDGSDWTSRAPMPQSRYGHGLAYSPLAGGVVLAGGDSTQTYVFNGASWTSLSMALPRSFYGAIQFDESRGRLVAVTEFGNVFEAPASGPWASRVSERPEGTYLPKVVYDPVRSSTILVPGSDGSSPAGTFLWNGASWAAVPGIRPSPAAAVYATFLSATVTVSTNGDTWKFDGAAWTNLAPATRPLPAGASYLYDFALACDSARGKVILFGGYSYDGNYNQAASQETWEFDGVNWQKRSPATSPEPRWSHAMAYDPSRGVTVLFGGYSYSAAAGSSYFGDTWEYDGTTWTQKPHLPGNEPPSAWYHQLAWVGSLGGVVAYGGNGLGPSAIAWNGTQWQDLPYVNPPQGYWRFGLAWDSHRDVLVVTNGANTFEHLRPALPVVAAPAAAASGVSYDVPWSAGGGTPTAYEIQEATEPTFAAPTTSTFEGLSSTFTHSPVVAETYHYRVRALNTCAGLASDWSNVGTVVVAPCSTSAPILTAPALVCASSTGNTASVPDAGPGATYSWQITNGSITAGADARQVTFTAGANGSVHLSVTVTPPGGCSPAAASTDVAIRALCLDPIPTPIVVGAVNTFTGSGFTAGSVIKLFVSTASGAEDTNPAGWTPTSWTPTSLTWDVPANIPLGQGFGSLLVVNTDQGYATSNVEGQLLYGDAADGLPTILSIKGVALSAYDPSIPGAHVETVLAAGSTVTITGTGFNGPLVNLYTATGNVGPLTPLAGGTSTSFQVVVPGTVPAGPGTFQVVNSGSGWKLSNAVAAVLRARISVASVTVAGNLVTVTGDGFCALTVVNFFNVQGGGVVNLGGLSGSTPVIPINYVDPQHITFPLPAAAQPGQAYVMALNPPYTPFTSSGTDPGGAFNVP